MRKRSCLSWKGIGGRLGSDASKHNLLDLKTQDFRNCSQLSSPFFLLPLLVIPVLIFPWMWRAEAPAPRRFLGWGTDCVSQYPFPFYQRSSWVSPQHLATYHPTYHRLPCLASLVLEIASWWDSSGSDVRKPSVIFQGMLVTHLLLPAGYRRAKPAGQPGSLGDLWRKTLQLILVCFKREEWTSFSCFFVTAT